MDGRQKQSEGISLLSMYNDDEDDEEMEEVDEQLNQIEEDEAMVTDDAAPRVTTPSLEVSRRRRTGIVEYEVAMSPEHEEGEFGEEIQSADGIQEITQGTEILEQLQNTEFDNRPVDSETVDDEDGSKDPAEPVDAFDNFLPPPTRESCSDELQRKIEKFIALKKVGRSFNAEVRNKKDYRNPDFLLHAVRYQDIDHIGSLFSKDVFDPHGYDKSDYYDEIEADMRRDKERKEQELKRSPRVDFIPGGTQPGTVIPGSKFSMPIPVATSAGLSNAADAVQRDGRQNKKSKWDKVDGDVRASLPPAGQDSFAAAAAHAALLSAANVGAGYTAYVQQKRREAEERRSSERKLERRS